jgi:hypothetical protein
MSGLLGGGGGGSTTQVVQNYSPEESAARNQLFNTAQSVYNQTSGQVANSMYPGSQIVPFSPATQASQDLLYNYALGPATDLANAGTAATKFGLNQVLSPQSNPYLQQWMQASVDPLVQAYSNTVMPALRSGGIQSGQYGGSRQGIAEGLAANDLMKQIGNTTANIGNAGYQAGLDTFSKTLATLPQTMQAGTLPAQDVGAIGSQQEALAQQYQDYLANARQYDLNAPWTPLNNYANIINGLSSPGTTTTSSGPEQSTASQILQTGLGAYSLASALPGVGSALGSLMSFFGL